MTTFITFNDLPVEIKQSIRRIQALASGERTTAEAAILTNYAAQISNEVTERNAANEIVRAQGITVPTGLSGFAKGAIFIDSDVAAGTQAMYENTGDTTTAAWNLIGGVNTGDIADDAVTTAKILALNVTAAKLAADSVTTVKILDGNVTLAKLAAGITPSHVVKFAGTVTWSGSGATLAATVTGVAATDIIMATIRVKPTEAAYLVRVVPTTNTLTFELSAANTSNDAQISYEVLRAAA